ncbi:MAG: OmpA family protein [Ignavibacteria bacterium]|nr:OmpA family protein [Ignavibacteria bacterium]
MKQLLLLLICLLCINFLLLHAQSDTISPKIPIVTSDSVLPKRVYEKQTLYPNGRLEIGALALATKYFGEYTDHNVGQVFGATTRYMMPFFPELGFGVRLTNGYLKYDRRNKERFGIDWERQFPAADFPNAATTGVIRETKVTAFEPLLFLNLFPRQRLNYYLFAGYSILLFTPQDIADDPLNGSGTRKHYPFYKDIDGSTVHLIGGLGIDYYITRNISIGVQAAYRYMKTDILDGYAQIIGVDTPTNPDGYAEMGFKLSYYLFGSSDTDGDGLSDDEESKLGTNPYSNDTDGDTISDYDEIYLYKTDPFSIDTDKDILTDSKEILVYGSNPTIIDTDSDGISDADEVLLYKTSPRLKDTDADSITDAVEIQNGSNPNSADSDSDSVPDNTDRCPNTFGFLENNGCPIQPQNIIIRDTITQTREVVRTIEKGQSYTPYGINFKRGKSDIEIESEPILDDVAKWLRENPSFVVEVRGHTDSEGAEAANVVLSKNRAESVRSYLVRQGIDPTRLSAKGLGKSKPVSDNSSLKGKAQNRRIEFYVKNK